MNKVFFTDLYLNITLYMIIMFFTLISATYILLDDNCNIIIRILSIIVLIAVVFLLLKKETYLPFLGTTFIPSNLFTGPQYPDGANLNYSIDMSDYEDGTKVMINNKIAEVFGRVSMDLTTIDVSHIKDCAVGDWCEFFSPELPISEIAKSNKLISYYFMTGIKSRVKKYFYQHKIKYCLTIFCYLLF